MLWLLNFQHFTWWYRMTYTQELQKHILETRAPLWLLLKSKTLGLLWTEHWLSWQLTLDLQRTRWNFLQLAEDWQHHFLHQFWKSCWREVDLLTGVMFMLLMHALLNAFSRTLPRSFEPLAPCLTGWQTMEYINWFCWPYQFNCFYSQFILRNLITDKG